MSRCPTGESTGIRPLNVLDEPILLSPGSIGKRRRLWDRGRGLTGIARKGRMASPPAGKPRWSVTSRGDRRDMPGNKYRGLALKFSFRNV